MAGDKLVRYENFVVRAVPSVTAVAGAQLDRVQEISVNADTNREPNKELGNPNVIDYMATLPSVATTLNQNDYNNIKAFRTLANRASGAVLLSHFKTAKNDILAYKTGDDGTFLGTTWWAKQRVSGFSFNIADANAKIERSFNLVGEKQTDFQGTQKYVVYLQDTADSTDVSGGDWTKTLNDPAPVESANVAGKYIYRLTRIRGAVSVDLAEGSGANQYEYVSGTGVLTAHSALIGDVYKIWYTAGVYITGASLFTANTVNAGSVQAYNISVYLGSGSNYISLLQSMSVDASLDRVDEGELGNREYVVSGVNDQTVTVNIPRFLEEYTIDEIMSGESANHPEIDVEKFVSNIELVVKVYTNSDKDTFAWGFKVPGLTVQQTTLNGTVNEYSQRGLTLVSNSTDAIVISEDEADLAFV